MLLSPVRRPDFIHAPVTYLTFTSLYMHLTGVWLSRCCIYIKTTREVVLFLFLTPWLKALSMLAEFHMRFRILIPTVSLE